MSTEADTGHDGEIARAEEAVREATDAYWQARDALESAELSLRLGLAQPDDLLPIQERVDAALDRLKLVTKERDDLVAARHGTARDRRGTARSEGALTDDGYVFVGRDRLGYVIGPRVPPAVTIEPGQTVVVETEDALSGRLRNPEDLRPERLERFHAERDAGTIGPNPVTGPIAVRGAAPGDTLIVRVERIDLDSQGVTRFRKAWSPLGDLFAEDRIKIVPIADGFVQWNERLRIPVRPMIGVIGTAPAIESLSSGRAGPHGGNIDCPEIAPGATVSLPVAVPGALLFVGDCHAVMADAEICNTAVETRATVTLTVDLKKGRPAGMQWPRVETPDSLIVVASGTPLDQTLQLAYRDLILWLEADYGWDRADAYLLATQVADGRLNNSFALRAVMPRRYLATVE